jgi:putative inorganic carbon (hco3(-)) transporter
MRQRLKDAALWIGGLEPGWVALAAPFLLFPTFRPTWTAGGLALLLLVWLLRWIGSGRPGIRTPMDGSLLLLALTIPIAVWASALPELTLPKLTGLILGLAAFRATANAVRLPRSLGRAAILFLGLGLALAAFGLVSTDWASKLPALGPLLARIPRLVQGLPGAEEGIHANELAGTMLLFLPVAMAAGGARIAGRRWIAWAARLAALILAAFFGAILVLTQSRGAWIGAAVGLGAMAWLRWRWARWLLAGAALLLALGLVTVGPQEALQAVLRSAGPAAAGTMLSTVNLEGRVELWNRALYAIQDFPFTGCGLGVFRQVVHVLYPLFLIGPDVDIAHAHNVFLQVALDVGLPGLIAYLALVGTALWVVWRVAQGSAGPYRWLALGIVGSLVAFHVYGLTDTVALGAKPGVAFWVLLALAAGVWSISQETGQGTKQAVESSAPEAV